MLGVAPIETVGDAAQVLVVLRSRGVEQVERNRPHALTPDASAYRPVRQRQLDAVACNLDQPQRRGVEFAVALLLPAAIVQALVEVSVVIEEADPDEGPTFVRTDSQVVAGQHP